jgi:hypothetical protein
MCFLRASCQGRPGQIAGHVVFRFCAKGLEECHALNDNLLSFSDAIGLLEEMAARQK